jgi:hypothetical protein
MGLEARHPLYSAYLPDWVRMRDTFEGDRAVKLKDFLYLRPTEGMIIDGALTKADKNEGWENYKSYRSRTLLPDCVRDAVRALLGMMHREPPTIELPAILEPLRERATAQNESLEHLLQRINEEQLISGRAGLFGDVITGEGERSGENYVSFYRAEDLVNWDPGQPTALQVENLNLVVLNESGEERQSDFMWQEKVRYRVLVLGEIRANEPGGVYSAGIFEDTTFKESEMFVPDIKGKPAMEIPFTFVNTQDMLTRPDRPPLLGLANLAIQIYAGNADYRQGLHHQSQDTLVVIGGRKEDQIRVGAGARVDVNMGGDAKYIGVSSTGLPEQRMAIENDKIEAQQMSGALADVSRQRESGEALGIRVAVRTATLSSIVTTGAMGLQDILRKLARWNGLSPEQADAEVIVTPNRNFVDEPMTGEELGKIMGAKGLGAPLAEQSVHANMKKRGMTDLEYEDEKKLLEEEAEGELAKMREAMASTFEDGPEVDEEEAEEREEQEQGAAAS